MFSYSNTIAVLLLEPEMHHLNKIVIPRIKSEWEDVAYSMGYRFRDVKAIKKESLNDLKECCQKLFSDWLDTSRNPTWKTLLEYIKDVDDLSAAAEEIEEELHSGSYTVYTSPLMFITYILMAASIITAPILSSDLSSFLSSS